MTVAPNVATFKLDNGMDVVVIPDHRSPVVTQMVWYKVGSADETDGKTGLAHYLEHLMFKGTKANPGSTFSDKVASVGGEENAFTSTDYTGYFQRVAKQHLGEMMALEADRMHNLQLTEAVAKPELNVVLEEMRMRVLNDPSAELGQTLDATLFVNSPYAHPTIGWPAEVHALTYNDALDFYRRWYEPRNAILVVAGDVTPDEVKSLAEKTYGKVPAGPPIPQRERPDTPELKGSRLVEFRDNRVNQSSTRIAWVVPSYTTAKGDDAEALDLLGQILGGGSTSRLYDTLVRDGGPAASAGAWYQSTALGETKFMAWGVPKEGASLEAIESGVAAAIADIAANGVTPDELARAKISLVSDAIYAQDSQAALARIFGATLATGGSVEDVQTWPKRIDAVSAADVQRVAAMLAPAHAVTARLIATAPQGAPAMPVHIGASSAEMH